MIVAVLGTGTMGAPMARHLSGRAFGEVRVWNRSPERAAPLADDGLTVADDVAGAVRGAGAVVVMLSDGDAVLAVLEEALPAMDDGAILVQTSTVGIDATERIALAAREAGVTLIDAPVLGTREPAEQGELIVLASGPDEAVDRCGGIFEAIGKKTYRLGEAGTGARVKLVVNAWLVSLTQALAETLALARSLDVEPETFLKAIGRGPLDVPYAHVKGGLMAQRDYEPASFALDLALKDAQLVLDAAARAELALPVVEAVVAQMTRASESGLGGQDMAATYEALWPAR